MVNTDVEHPTYENGHGWEASMIKLSYIRELVDGLNVQDNDYILSVDSDVVFTSSDVFEYLDGSGIIGIKHQQPYQTKFGLFGHMSGALIFLKGSVAKKMTAISESELVAIRFNHFKAYDITENEDVVLSYLAKYVGASERSLLGGLSSGDFEYDLLKCNLKSFYHLNYMPETFMGVPVTGKWDIPKVLQQKGIEL